MSIKLLDRGGVEGITIRAVARGAGVSHAAPVNHFKDREALLTAVCARLFEQLNQEIENALSSATDDLGERVTAFANALITYGLKYPDRYRMLWRRDLTDASDQNLQSAMDRIYDMLLAEISKAGSSKSYDHHTIAIGLWSLSHGYVSMRINGNFRAVADEVSGLPRQDAIIKAFLNYLPK